MVIAELFSNALEYGVLGLVSEEKRSAESFLRYYRLRQQALDGLRTGSVRIDMRYQSNSQGDVLIVRVSDSGQGFAHARALLDARGGELNASPRGRGLVLLQSLCRRVDYPGCGNQVEVEYLLGTG